jgi:hypothetical protein
MRAHTIADDLLRTHEVGKVTISQSASRRRSRFALCNPPSEQVVHLALQVIRDLLWCLMLGLRHIRLIGIRCF